MVVDNDLQEESEDVDLVEPVQDDNDMLPLCWPNHNTNILVISEIINEEQRQEEDKVSAKVKYDVMLYDWLVWAEHQLERGLHKKRTRNC